MSIRGAAFALAGLLGLLLVAADPALAQGATPRAGPVPVVGCEQGAAALVVTHSIDLDPNCTYSGGLTITRSHVVLDCRGARIDQGAGRSGVGILVSAPTDAALTDITVRNCVVHGFTNGVRVTRVGFKALVAGHEYDHDYSQVRILDDQISGSGGVGLYVDAYVTGVTIDDVSVTGAGSAGLYLEAGSKGSMVTNSTIVDNGFANTDPAGTPIQVGSLTFRYVSTGREGIAVDGSQDNTIRGNLIEGNSYGGVLLYENCGEYVHQHPDQWWPRHTSASGNLIVDNTIADEPNGVWIGSRMAENTASFDCATPPYDTTGGAVHVLDHATGNTVYHNRFEGDTHGVRVEDDGNQVRRNTFVDAPGPTSIAAPVEAVLIGTEFRTRALDQPVAATVVADNTSRLAGVAQPYTVIWGQVGTIATDDRRNQLRVGLAPGVQPTINPALLVLRIWLTQP